MIHWGRPQAKAPCGMLVLRRYRRARFATDPRLVTCPRCKELATNT